MTTNVTFSVLVIMAIILSGCSPVPAPAQPPAPVASPMPTFDLVSVPQQGQKRAGSEFVGRVIDMDGNPIRGATVESGGTSGTSGRDGWFRLSGKGDPQWIKVMASGFIPRTRAALPGEPVLFRLTPDDGKTILMHFAGDTMFGGRFYDPNGDDFTEDGLLPLTPSVDDHLRLLDPVQSLLESADLTIVNFESTLGEQAFVPKNAPRPAAFHPTAAYVYASHPNSVPALKQAGVDLVDLGNNHNYDLLEVGLKDTLSAFEATGLPHFGAGTNEASAWAPTILSVKDQSIAFIGCTTARIPLGTVTKLDIPFVASNLHKKGGAAYCSEVPLRSAITAAKQQADMVVVMIHGGREYDRVPTKKAMYLTEIARRAGATLIIHHHSHVVSGFSWKDPSLTAWGLGNFVFDQAVWPSLESYMLAVYVREGKIIRAYAEPLIIDGLLPHGLTGRLADYVARGAAGRQPGPYMIESGAMEIDLNGTALQHTYSQILDGGETPGMIISVPQAQWLSSFKGTGTLSLGRDLLWVGGFESEEVKSRTGAAPLWNLDMGNVQFGPDYAYEGQAGIRLSRGASNTGDSVTTNLHRVLVRPLSRLSITGMIRVQRGVVPFAQLSWYSATVGGSFSKEFLPLEVERDGEWHPFRIDVKVPVKAVGLGLYLRLKPPETGTGTADFDNIRMIEWAPSGTAYGPQYDHLLLIGTGELTFVQRILPGAEQWITGPSNDQNK